GGAANVIRSLKDSWRQIIVRFSYNVRRPCAFGVGALPQTPQALFEEKGLTPKPFCVFVPPQIPIYLI
ncbi:MAG: hypothetical protein IKR76_03000, partial [Ruminococcus sp.]|nr:hypothetical protein [Ruminococcus sp.]